MTRSRRFGPIPIWTRRKYSNDSRGTPSWQRPLRSGGCRVSAHCGLRWQDKWARSGCGWQRATRTVEDLQNLIAPNLSRMIKQTSRFTVSGIDELELSAARVYLGNHRDIVMDPAYANYALHRAGASTLAIAIGDNLLSKPWVAD